MVFQAVSTQSAKETRKSAVVNINSTPKRNYLHVKQMLQIHLATMTDFTNETSALAHGANASASRIEVRL